MIADFTLLLAQATSTAAGGGPPPPPPALITPAALGTFAGLSLALTVMTNVVAMILRRMPPPVIAFLLALLISVFGSMAMNTLTTTVDYGLAVLNAGLLFTSATGIQEMLARIPRPGEPVGPPPP